MKVTKSFCAIALASIMTCTGVHLATTSTVQAADAPTYKVVLKSEVEWTHLNPKRGDLAPKAGTLWGDRNGTEPTGYLLKPSKDFQSPPHIHNVSYRGLVISGLLHNDDPKAEYMWMPAGSFWTQPAGEVHITAAKGEGSLAYIEIEKGPYLVWPKAKAFDNGERPVNIDKRNIIWLDAANVKSLNAAPTSKAKLAFLWGKQEKDQMNGTLIKLPAGFTGEIKSKGDDFRAVVIQGKAQHTVPNAKESKTLDTGSYFSSQGSPAAHQIKAEGDTVIYVRTNGQYELLGQ